MKDPQTVDLRTKDLRLNEGSAEADELTTLIQLKKEQRLEFLKGLGCYEYEFKGVSR